MTTPSTVSVAVFAYNEEASITACLDALAACAGEADMTVHVLINGCTDRTEAIVGAYRPMRFRLVPVVIGRGDKANAWNHYTHGVAPETAAIHVFTDGDMIVAPGSIRGLLARLSELPDANGCAALPISGRSRDAFREKLVRNREMAGNLYAIRGSCLMAFRHARVVLPIGVFGEDGLVTTLIKHDLDMAGPRRDDRITATTQGGFGFRPLSPWQPSDWRIYRNRKMRYAVRRRQAHMLYPLLFEQGMAAMPAHVVDLYRARHTLVETNWYGLDAYFDWIARRRILRDVAASTDVKDEERAHLYS